MKGSHLEYRCAEYEYRCAEYEYRCAEYEYRCAEYEHESNGDVANRLARIESC
jgi:hypothetical protein